MSDYEDYYLSEENVSLEEDYQSENSCSNQNNNRQLLSPYNDSGASDSDCDSSREKTELELLRERNIKEANKFLESLMNDPQFADVVSSVKELNKPKVSRITKPSQDPSFRCKYKNIPLEKRRSSRLQNIPPVFFKEDLIDEIDFDRKRKRSDHYDYNNLEAVIYRPKVSRASSGNTIRPYIIPVEEVTEKMIANIARKVRNKVYSAEGSSCHQCRQKTKDQKTCCRNESCVGVRGQFCGICLENRYGEDAAEALKDPNWNCPVCRGICNCSFCRQKAGKRPTGILAPLAQQNGHKSVKDFLDSLKGEGDYAHQDFMWQGVNNPEYLLGYTKDLKFFYMGLGIKHEVKYFLSWDRLKEIIRDQEIELESIIDLHDEPRSLLGFLKGTNEGLLDDGTRSYMGPRSSL